MSKLSETDEIRQFMTKDQNSLSASQHETLTALENLNKEAPNIAKKLENDLRNFQASAREIFISQIPEDLMDRKDELLGIFNQSLIERSTQEADEVKKALQKRESLLLGGLLTSYAVKALEEILEFEKKIDSAFPGASEKIMKAAGNALTALVAAHFPVIAMAMKASGIMEKAEDFLKIDNLEKNLKDLKSKIAAIEQDQKLENTYKNGAEVAQIAELSSIPAQSIASLGLETSSLKSVKSNLIADPKAASLLQEASRAAEMIPNTQKGLTDKLEAIKKDMSSSINNAGLPASAQQNVANKIEAQFKEVKKTIEPILERGRKFFEKTEIQQKAANMIIKVAKDALEEFNKEPNKSKTNQEILQQVAKIVKDSLQGQVTELMKQATKSPAVARELGLNNAVKASLDKMASQQTHEAVMRR